MATVSVKCRKTVLVNVVIGQQDVKIYTFPVFYDIIM